MVHRNGGRGLIPAGYDVGHVPEVTLGVTAMEGGD